MTLSFQHFLTTIAEAGPMAIRLVGDPTKKAVVEVYDGASRWGRICTDTWKLWHAQLVCNHFGYASALGAMVVRSYDSTYLSNVSTTQNFILLKPNPNACLSSNITSVLTHCTVVLTTECECSQLNAGVTCQSYSDGSG